MGKLGSAEATLRRQTGARSPVRTTGEVAINHQGGTGYARDPKSELFLLAVSNMVSEDTFYEGATERDARFRDLIHQATVLDPDWVARFVPYLRSELNMRTASIVMAVESVLSRKPDLATASISVRTLVDSALQRADEPGEFVAYWRARTGKVTLPGGVQRGLQDAMRRLITEKAVLKYDGLSGNWRLGDVVELVHPKPKAAWQDDLFRYLLDRRHHSDEIRVDFERLPMLAANQRLRDVPLDGRRGVVTSSVGADTLKAAGFNWEDLSGWLQGPLDAPVWEAMLGSMGYMALLRNLRNFEQAGISPSAVKAVCDRLADPSQVARSRQLPMRFLSAFKATSNMQWWPALEAALNLSLQNVPSLPGRSLILVDLSGSMWDKMSARSELQRWEAAATFGLALALRAEFADLVAFGDSAQVVKVSKGASLLPLVQAMNRSLGGTRTGEAVAATLRPGYHDRVVILTDEQQSGSGYYGSRPVDQVVPADTWLHTFNLAGYRLGQSESGVGTKRSVFGGLSDRSFALIPLLEQGTSQEWPFMPPGPADGDAEYGSYLDAPE